MSDTDIINDWNPETASLIHTLKKHGFAIVGGNNGEDEVAHPDTFPTSAAFLDELLACDEANLFVTRTATKASKKTPGARVLRRYYLFLVLGNSPGELVCDYGIPSDEADAKALEAACDEHATRWEDKKQPLTTWAERWARMRANGAANGAANVPAPDSSS